MTRTSRRLAAEVARIATTPASIEDRAAALLEVLRRVVPCDAAWLALRDPERRSHTPLATSGYAEPLREVFRAPDADDEVELLGLNQRRSPMLASEFPVPLSESSSWADHLLPAGFRGGIAAGLFTPDDRHLGFLSLLTDDIARPTPRERDVIALLTPLVALAVDRMRTVTAVANVVRGALGGVVLTRSGDALPVPGLPRHAVLMRGSPALAFAATRLMAGERSALFLCPHARVGDDGGYVRVTVLDCAREYDHLLAVVTVSPPGDLRGLSRRQLSILGFVVDAWADRQIGAALATTEHDVRDQVGRILCALQAPDRTLAVVRTLREGLYLPGPLSRVRG
jgi:hypothetical protein